MGSSSKGIVVYVSGSWDLFHVGHLRALARAKTHGDWLLVGVSTDELMLSYKKARPVIPFDERREIIESIGIVDEVIKQENLMDIAQLKRHKVDVATIGDDWEGKHLDGLEWMKQNGKKVIYLPYTRHTSTTLIKKKIIMNAYDLIRADLERELELDLPLKDGS